MVMDLDDVSFASYSHAMSFDLWTDSHPLLDLQAPSPEWESWIWAILSHIVPGQGLVDFIQMSGALIPGVGKVKWTQVHIKILVKLHHKLHPSVSFQI